MPKRGFCLDTVILAGGQGTRIQPVLGELPKCLAPIDGRPFLELLLDLVEWIHSNCASGKLILALGKGADHVVSHCDLNVRKFGIKYSIEDSPLGTGGALLKALDHCDTNYVLVLNGDTCADVDWKTLIRMSTDPEPGHAGFVAIQKIEQVDSGSRFDAFLTEGPSHRITALRSRESGPGPGWRNAGVYLLSRSKLLLVREELASREGPLSLEADILTRLFSFGLHGFPLRGNFADIGTPESLHSAQSFLPGGYSELSTKA